MRLQPPLLHVGMSSTSMALHPWIRNTLDERYGGGSGLPSEAGFDGDEFNELLRELSASADPGVRRQTLHHRILQSDGRELGLERQPWESLVAEAASAGSDGLLEPFGELMIWRELSDGWVRRQCFRRAAEASSMAVTWARKMGISDVESALTASLGSIITLGGYIAEGLGVITRSAASSLDCSTHRFIGSDGRLSRQRQQVMELADADEHSRNYERAAIGYQVVTSLVGPTEDRPRANTYMALARCLCRLGNLEMATEMFDQVVRTYGASTPVVGGTMMLMKQERTRALLQAAGGDVAEALHTCEAHLTPELRDDTLGIYLEMLVDATSIARRADEPGWIIAQIGDAALHNADGVGLAATFAYQDLAWAYRRVGDRRNASRCRELAGAGRERFTARSGYSPISTDSAPGVLRSARELHQRAMGARESEQVSLARGIGSVAHDVRHQLQSLEFLTGPNEVSDGAVDTIRSIVSFIDEILAGLLREVEADREIALTQVCLTAVAHDVADRFRSTAAQKGIELHCNISEPFWCHSDRIALDRIVSNLVSNAIKYSPVGGDVEITATTVGDSVVDLHIIDSGPGIPSAEIDGLFRWGGTLSSEPTAGESQHGIGLFTVQRLAQLTGASVRPHPRRSNVPSTVSVRLARSWESEDQAICVTRPVLLTAHPMHLAG